MNIYYLKSYHIQKAYIKSDGGSLELKNGIQIPVSNEKIQTILEAIEIIKR